VASKRSRSQRIIIGMWMSLLVVCLSGGALVYACTVDRWSPAPWTVPVLMAAIVLVMTVVSVQTHRRLKFGEALLRELEEDCAQRLPEEARKLLYSPPRTFYFLDHNAVGELHAQIAGRLRLVESREVRKRAKQAEFGFAHGPVSAGGGVGSSAEHENRYASRPELASEFNEVLEHLIVHGQIRFGLDSPRPDGSGIEPQQYPRSVDSSPPKFIDALQAELSQENAPQSGEEAEVPRLLRSVMRAFRSYHLTSVTQELERAAEVPQYVFLSGRYAVHLAEDYIILTATYPFWGDLSAASMHPRFCMRVRRDAPSLTSAGRDAFSPDQGGNLTLRCIGKTLSWDGEAHTLWVSPIAIF
jgi:hypothetical protein